MSTVFRPVGPQPARVYWVRRLVVAIVVAALVVVVWSVLRPGGADDADAAGQDAGQQAGGDSDAGTDAQAADGEAAAEGASLACTGASLTVALTATERTYAADASPQLVVSLTNTGSVPCTVDAGAAAREILITSGSDRIWSSLDCATDPQQRLLLLEPGAKDEDTVVWDRTRSAEGCPADLPAPRPGTYSAVATIEGTSSASAVFDLA